MSLGRRYQMLRLHSAVIRANFHAWMCGLLARSVNQYVVGEQPSNRQPGAGSRVLRWKHLWKMRLIWALAYASRPILWIWMKIL
jgi:hypothetical protein